MENSHDRLSAASLCVGEEPMTRSTWGYAAALGSAAFVGLFTVVNKWLLTEHMPPLTAAAWTYFAAGVALAPWAIRAGGFRLSRPWVVAGWILAGSIVGPSLYFVGLDRTSGVEGVLLINTEAIFTALLAFAFFREPTSVITFLCGGFVLIGAVWLSWPSGNGELIAGQSLGAALIALGYVGWATENNLGRLLGTDIPAVTLVCMKALAAAFSMAALAAVFGQSLAISWSVVPGIIVSGAVSLGLSLALFYAAMQRIGAGRTGLISSTSALWGVASAILLLHESLDAKTILAGTLMLAGVIGFGWESRRTEHPVSDPDRRLKNVDA
jgi:drug/metabolite transporter (DMT)-like permease